MRKIIKILIIVIVFLTVFLLTYSFIFEDGKDKNPKEKEDITSQKDDADNLHHELREEIDKIDGNVDGEGDSNNDDENDESYDDKMNKVDDMAKEASDRRDDKLGSDTLKSSGKKYSGEPCKERCW